MKLRALDRVDMPAARSLLAASDLPTDDLDDSSISFAGAFDGNVILGVIGLQACGTHGLLRSLAVLQQRRGDGVARALCEHVFEMAAERAMSSLWLLTISAKDYFTRHAFELVPREQAPDEIRSTAQFSSLCPASAYVMRRR